MFDQASTPVHRSARLLLAAGAALVALLAAVTSAEATPVAGENGRIVLTSYQNFGQSRAELFLLPVPSSTGGGTLSAPIATSANERHRHPTWSPDRTKVAYARGVSAANTYDIFMLDLTNPGSPPVNVTQSPGSNEDRPAWSPDGTHLAFERDSGVPADRDIVISLPNGGGQTNITNTVGAIEGQPAWSPNSSTIYYEKGNAQNPATNTDIVKRSVSFGPPITVGAETLAVADDANRPEIQPAISPNGDKICYGTGYPGAPTTDVKVALLTTPASAGTKISVTGTAYECTWSPDNTLVAYTAGAGSAGDLVMVRGDGTSLSEIPLAGGADIQTNPDWAPDGRPECPNTAAQTSPGTAVSIAVSCADTGPAYERSNVREFVTVQPQNGTTEQASAGDPITYTPNAGFKGSDSFEVGSFDEFGFGSDKGQVTISVAAVRCGGKDSTIVGTPGDDTIQGTPGADVISGLEGDDRIGGGAGNDVICGGDGDDRLSGGAGKDRLFGQKGEDSLNGGKQRDRCSGGPQKDRIKSCP